MDHYIHIHRLFDIGLRSQADNPILKVKIELEKSIARYFIPIIKLI